MKRKLFRLFSTVLIPAFSLMAGMQANAQSIADGSRVQVTAKFKIKKGGGDFNTTVAVAEAGDAAVVIGNRVMYQGDPWWQIKLDKLPTSPGYIRESFIKPIASPPPPPPPTPGIASVAITAPSNGASFAQGSAVTISASASAQQGTSVQKVEFYDGANKIGEDSSSPYSISVSNLSVGSHTLSATAIAASGLSAKSSNVSISITTSPQPPPPTPGIASVAITSPSNGASFAQGSSVTISASASAQSGTSVQKVEFYDGANKLGEDSSSPYSISVSSLSTGSHTLSATAIAASGLSAKSANVSISITASPQPPTGNLSAFSNPTNGNVPFARETKSDADEERKLAFPSAEGVGRFADPDIGPGQNFQIFKVTNLNDSGAGSLRACVMASGPRVCIFEVSGNIVVDSDMMVMGDARSDLYVAGQTSPGGIQLISGPNNPKAPFRAQRMSDLVVRYLKLRTGDNHALSSDADSIAVLGNALSRDTHDIILDHLSLQWSTDETAHFGGVANFTMQWSLASEPLRCGTCRDDRKNTHNYGVFADRAISMTLYKNLFMGGYWRNPNVTAHEGAHLINNVAYDFGQYGGQFYVNHTTNSLANIVGNWYGYGPNTTRLPASGQKPHCMFGSFEGTPTSPLGFEFYLNGNICARDLTGNNNYVTTGGNLTSPILFQNGSLTTPTGSPQVLFNSPRGGGLSVKPSNVQSATQALKDVISYAGARADVFSNPRRDFVDQRAIDQLMNCDNRSYSPQPRYNSSVPAPGYPNLTAGVTWSWANNDTDNDGMLDSWELAQPGIATLGQLHANGDFDGDGWSDLEEFLNYLAGEHINFNGTGNPSRIPAANCGY